MRTQERDLRLRASSRFGVRLVFLQALVLLSAAAVTHAQWCYEMFSPAPGPETPPCPTCPPPGSPGGGPDGGGGGGPLFQQTTASNGQKQPGGQCQMPPCTHSPTYVATGNFVDATTDLAVRTSGFSLVAARRYDSARAADGPLGVGWYSNLTSRLYYATYLFAAPSSYQKEADVTTPNGTLERFVQNADGSFTPPTGIHDTLVQNGDGSFDLTSASTKSSLHFGSDGSLQSITDNYGNILNLTYSAGKLQQIAD